MRQPRLAACQESGFITLDGIACGSELCTEEQFRERIKGASESALRMGARLGAVPARVYFQLCQWSASPGV